MNLRERFGKALLGDQLEEMEHLASALLIAYQEGPYTLPPEELMRQFQEYDSELVLELVDRMAWEQIGQYAAPTDEQRQRAIQDSTRLWTYSPVAQWIISLWTSYGLGEEIAIQPVEEGEGEKDARQVWSEFWEADRNQAILATDRLRNISDWLLVTGNRFFVFFISTIDGETTIRRVLQDQIVAIITDPKDDSRPLYYKRVWSQNGESRTAYYRDWRAVFDDKFPDDIPGVDENQIIGLSESEIEEQEAGTQIVMLHIPFQELDESSLFGWPLLCPAGTSWFRGHREFFQNRLTNSRAIAAFVRRRTVKGGTRAVEAVRNAVRSSLVTSGVLDTNPPPAAGAEDITNQAITTEDLPMKTGASDAKTDGEMFTWMVGLSGRLFPHYLGLGDSYRLATACYSEDTEFLGETGWKKWYEWRAGERIAAYDHDCQQIRYIEPASLEVYNYEGEMVRIKARSIDALVTPNHRMLAINENWRTYKNGEHKRTEFEVIEAQNLPSDFSLPTKVFVKERLDIEQFLLPGYAAQSPWEIPQPARVLDMDTWLRFIGWYVTDGSISLSGSGGRTVRLGQKRRRGIRQIDEVVSALPFKFNRTQDSLGSVTWRSHDCALYDWLGANCGKGAINKHLPDFAIQLNVRQAEILLRAVWAGDGHFYNPTKQIHAIGVLSSVSKTLIDQCQTLLLHIGGWCSYGQEKKLKRKARYRSYWLNWSDYDKKLLYCYRNVSRVDYTGVVWCFSAPPYGMFVTRRNGCPLIAGNTSMEKPLEMQFSAYRKRLSSMFRQMVRIVLLAQEKYNNGSFKTMEAEITTDRLVQLDLTNITAGLTSMFKDIVAMTEIPDESKTKLTVFAIQTILQAAGASNVSEIIDEEHFDLEQEEGLTEQSDKVQPRGQPLEPWGDEPVPITPEDVARSIRDWDRHMPDEAKGLLTARTLTPDEEGKGPGGEA